jgi:hypothetical protein
MYDPYGYYRIAGFDIGHAMGIGQLAMAVPVGAPMPGPMSYSPGAPAPYPVGYGSMSYAGPPVAPQGGYNPGLAAAYAQAEAQRAGSQMFHAPGGAFGAHLGYKPPEKGLKRQPMPFPATTVLAAAATATITLLPQRAFRVERLVMTSSVTPSAVVLSQINVGQEPQFVGTGVIPLDAFASGAFDTYLRGTTAVPGITITIVISNQGLVAENVNGAFLGEAIEL